MTVSIRSSSAIGPRAADRALDAPQPVDRFDDFAAPSSAELDVP
jgi:hypothetical protein